MSNKKFIRPKDVENIYSIKVSTLSKQRQGNYGLPYHVVGRKKNEQRLSTQERSLNAVLANQSDKEIKICQKKIIKVQLVLTLIKLK